jgi:hypothetical protein
MAPHISLLLCRRDPSIARHDPVARRRTERNEFPARSFESEAVFVIPARWLRPQRCHANAVLNLGRLRMPLFRRAVRFSRHPALDVPAVHGKIFWDAPQFDFLANRVPVRIAVRPTSANPCQPRPAPNHAKVWLAIRVHATGASAAPLPRRRRFMRFSCCAYQGLETFLT